LVKEKNSDVIKLDDWEIRVDGTSEDDLYINIVPPTEALSKFSVFEHKDEIECTEFIKENEIKKVIDLFNQLRNILEKYNLLLEEKEEE